MFLNVMRVYQVAVCNEVLYRNSKSLEDVLSIVCKICCTFAQAGLMQTKCLKIEQHT